MNDRSLAISILQRARDALNNRLTQRVIESRQEIEDDAEGCSYLSEIETIYEQIGGRLAHLNAMLTNLPPVDSPPASDTAASEIVYADLAAAYPTGLELETPPSATLLALPAPAHVEEVPAQSLCGVFQKIVADVQMGDVTSAGRLIAELFDIRPSQARRAAQAFARQVVHYPDLAQRIEDLGSSFEAANEYSAATLLGECFGFQAIDALSLVRALKTPKIDVESER